MVMHPLYFRGLGERETQGRPVILTRTDDDFVDALFSELKGDQPIATVRKSQAQRRDKVGVLRLLQPVHRTFQLVVVEIGCDLPGHPRIDASKVDSAGLVVRRLSRQTDPRRQTREQYPYGQGWFADSAGRRGWASFDTPDSAELDPDPKRRPAHNAGAPEVTARLEALLAANRPFGAESTSPLFVVEPAACRAAKRTVLFGMIPTASVESVETPAAASPVFSPDDIQALLPTLLRRTAAPSLGPLAGSSFTYAEAVAREQSETRGPRSGWYLKNFLLLLRQLVTQFRAFDDTVNGRAVMEALNGLTLSFSSEPKSRPAGAYLKAAAEILVLQPDETSSRRLELPKTWPTIPSNVSQALESALGQAAEQQYASIEPKVMRFDDLSAQYEVRAFVRVKSEDGCPPVLVWSTPSEPFTIAPWYENGGRPVAIQLPDITRENIKDLRPNVALKLPKRLFNFLNENDPKDLLDGKGKEGSNIGIDWICSFSIPIITLCAFIVLFIFLSLLNIVFWWLPFIRICFPLPSIRRQGT